MVLLPILVIFLVVMGIYLSFQKNMSNMNKIIIAVLAVIIFNIAYSYLKRTTEGFTADEKLNDEDSYDIEVASPDYSDENIEDDTDKEKYEDTANSKKPSGISEVVSSINLQDRLQQIQNDITQLDSMTPSPSSIPTGTPSTMNESFADATTGISQHDVKGTGNIFNPQVIVRNGDSGQSSVPVYSGAQSWQTPVTDLWGGDSNPTTAQLIESKRSQTMNTNGGGKCVYNDPMGYITKNISDSYDVANNNKRKCGEYPAPPESEGDIEYPYASKTKSKDKSKVYYPGYSFAPPSTWDVPQKRPPPCIPDKTRLCPMGVFDRGTPTNVLELTADGNQCASENECELTNVGSLMPKFEFREIYDY